MNEMNVLNKMNESELPPRKIVWKNTNYKRIQSKKKRNKSDWNIAQFFNYKHQNEYLMKYLITNSVSKFIFQFRNNSIPHKVNLKKLNLTNTNTCSLCKTKKETLPHIVLCNKTHDLAKIEIKKMDFN